MDNKIKTDKVTDEYLAKFGLTYEDWIKTAINFDDLISGKVKTPKARDSTKEEWDAGLKITEKYKLNIS